MSILFCLTTTNKLIIFVSQGLTLSTASLVDIKTVLIFIFMRLRKLKKRWLIYRPPGMKGLTMLTKLQQTHSKSSCLKYNELKMQI